MKRKKLDSIRGVKLSVVMTIVVILGLVMLAPMVMAASNQNPGVLPIDSKPYGHSYGEWSVNGDSRRSRYQLLKIHL